jgi:hypothetical protein
VQAVEMEALCDKFIRQQYADDKKH